MRARPNSIEEHPKFEETYPRYEFSGLVGVALDIGRHLRRQRPLRFFFGLLGWMKGPRGKGPTAPAT